MPDVEKEKELNLRLNRNVGDWDWSLLSEFSETILSDIGFTSEELDDIFDIEDTPEQFDLQKELEKLDIAQIEIQKGDILRVENRDVNYETVQIIQVKKDYKQSKFRTLLKEDLAKGEAIEYLFTEEGLYKVKCLFSGCVSTIAVA